MRGTLLAMALVIVLAGCTAQPPPVASPTTSPTSTPAPSASAPIAVTEFIVGSSALEVRTDGEPESAHTWFDDPLQTVARLTELIGVAPTVAHDAASEFEAPRTRYTWDGFEFTVVDVAADPPYFPNQYVTVTAPSTGGVRISTAHGISVGSTLEALEATGAVEYFDSSAPDGAGRLYPVDVLEQSTPDGATDYTRVYVFVSLTSGTVYRIVAPHKNLGI